MIRSKNRKLKSRVTKRKSIKRKQKSIGKSPKRITRSKRIKIKIKSRFGEGDEDGAGAEEKKEDIPSGDDSPEADYVEFYKNLPFEDTVIDNNGPPYNYAFVFKEVYDSNNLITITDALLYSNTIRDLFFSKLNRQGGVKEGDLKNFLGQFSHLNEDETKWNKDRQYSNRPPYQTMVNYKNELEDLKRKIKVNEKIIFLCRRDSESSNYAPPGFQGTCILFVFTNYGKLLRNDFMSPGYLEYDSNTLLHPEAFEIMKKLWELDKKIPTHPNRWYNGVEYSGIIDFFKNIVDISNTLRDKDMKLYELKKEVDRCEKERIEEMETMLRNYENIRDQDFPH